METCMGKVTAMDNLSWHTLECTTNALLWQSGEVRWQEYSILHPLNLITGSLHQTASVIQQEHAGHIILRKPCKDFWKLYQMVFFLHCENFQHRYLHVVWDFGNFYWLDSQGNFGCIADDMKWHNTHHRDKQL